MKYELSPRSGRGSDFAEMHGQKELKLIPFDATHGSYISYDIISIEVHIALCVSFP